MAIQSRKCQTETTLTLPKEYNLTRHYIEKHRDVAPELVEKLDQGDVLQKPRKKYNFMLAFCVGVRITMGDCTEVRIISLEPLALKGLFYGSFRLRTW